jgi:hypothetical protein
LGHGDVIFKEEDDVISILEADDTPRDNLRNQTSYQLVLGNFEQHVGNASTTKLYKIGEKLDHLASNL